MKLITGDKAPNFTAVDIEGREISLASLRGHRVFLAFFRNVNCPFCNLRVHQLSKKQDEFTAAGLKMIFIFESSNKHLQRSIFHKEVSQVPLIGDHEKEIYSLYGVESSFRKTVATFFQKGSLSNMKAGSKFETTTDKEKNDDTLIPADFLINEKGIIETAYYGKNISDHLDIKTIESFIPVQETIVN